jgi:hypothetical protein
VKTSSLIKQQEAIKTSRNVTLSEKFERNMQTLIRLENEFYASKRIELGFETLFQITLRLVSSTPLSSIFECLVWSIILNHWTILFHSIPQLLQNTDTVCFRGTYKIDIGPHCKM